ncbi:hypothetical protein K8R78_00115 [bacterium]|nr:hypothetical protein [bacterium]
MKERLRFVTLLSMLAVLLLAVTLTVVLAEPGSFSARSEQPAFWRYEVVVVAVDGVPSATQELIGVPTLNGEAIAGVTGETELRFREEEDGYWRGYWAMPWDPALGDYQMKIEARDSAGAVLQSTAADFTIRGRAPSEVVPLPHFALTLETDANYYNARLGGPRRRIPGWKNLISWPEYVGADSFWFSAAITKTTYNPTAENPWLPLDLEMVPVLGRECQRAGIDFGCWIASFFPYGASRPAIDYEFSRNYVVPDEPGSSPGFWWTLNASLNCELRKNHIVEMAQWLQDQPQVDYIGLDYIRSGPGGFEMVGDFVTELGLIPYDGFLEQPLEVQMTWLVGQSRTYPRMSRLWAWWRASKSAQTLAEIKERAGITKPLWCFVLGWMHQHGQDLNMMTDAGADFVALMLYDATRNEWDGLLKEWPKEYRDGRVNLLGGVIADTVQLENPWNPNAPFPIEMGNRAEEAAFDLAGSAGPWDDIAALNPEYPGTNASLRSDGLLEGLFVHDLERMAYRTGGWTLEDYAITGAASMSKLRQASGDIPIEIVVRRPEGAGAFLFDVPCEVTNHGDTTLTDIRVRTEPTRFSGIAQQDTVWIDSLAPGETVTVHPLLYAFEYTAEHVIAASAWWGSPEAKDIAFDCRYQIPWVIE